MTQEKKRINIALHAGKLELLDNNTMWFVKGVGFFISEKDCVAHLPDYFNDLNVIYEAEKVIENRDLWIFNLAEEVGVDVHWNGRSSCTEWPIHICDKIQSATAAQRAEALWRTLNPFEEL